MARAQRSVLGDDLALTRFTGTAGAAPLDVADSWGSLDLAVAPGGAGGLDLPGEILDLATVSARRNLAQALIVRLLTPRGSLAPLGHVRFGSRLVELIGRLNNDTTRNLARLFTLEALREEPRVKEVLDLAVTVTADQPEVIRIAFSVLPVGEEEALALGLEVTL